MTGPILPVSIASMGHIERVAYEAEIAPATQQAASQQIALESLKHENKQVQKLEESDKSLKVGDETPEQRKQKKQHARSHSEDGAENEDKKEGAAKRPWAGNLLDIKI